MLALGKSDSLTPVSELIENVLPAILYFLHP